MDLNEAYNFLLFYINKFQGSWYPPEELDRIVDFGQLSYYESCFVKYGTGQRLTDALAPFKKTYSFDPTINANPNGLINTPTDYMDLIDLFVVVNGKRVAVPILNEDEIDFRTNSQVIPMSTYPFGEIISNWDIQLYPNTPATGTMSYFSRPPKPFFSYTIVSGRVIVYNAGASTQLLWGDDEVNSVLIKTLETIGINLSAQDLQQWAAVKDQQNLTSVIKT